DRYVEDGGRMEEGRRIDAWGQVRGRSAAFGSRRGDVWFRLDRDPDPRAPGVRMFHGREMARGRLAWAGFGYCLRPGPPSFSYAVRIGRLGRRRAGAAAVEDGGRAQAEDVGRAVVEDST
ncbi:MAG TPA: hypothetical protein VK576_03185, partial [Thermoleophilia bacterium]|nr:hypothetical protein [Thermoleophilia bacterium]